jgi:hypothetical protein
MDSAWAEGSCTSGSRGRMALFTADESFFCRLASLKMVSSVTLLNANFRTHGESWLAGSPDLSRSGCNGTCVFSQLISMGERACKQKYLV